MKFDDVREQTESIRKLGGPVQGEWLFNLVQQAQDKTFVCEIGAYFGYLTTIMAKACEGSSKRVLTVDHMIGGNCDFQEGTDCSYFSIVDTLIENGVYDKVIPFPLKSTDAFPLFKLLEPRISLLYLDGDHCEGNVMWELCMFERFVIKGGIICGDDCLVRNQESFNEAWNKGNDSWLIPGKDVAQAAYRFFKNNPNYEILPDVPGNQFGFRKVD